MSDYFATAFIRVKADSKKFREDLDTLKRSVQEKTIIRIPVKANPAGFKADLQKAVTKTPISIPVTPDTKGFRTALIKQLSGMAPVPVKVVPAAVASQVSEAARKAAIAADPAASKAAASADRQAAAEQRLAGVQAQLLEVQLLLDAATQEGLTAEQQKVRLQEALAASTKLSASGAKELAAAYEAEAAGIISTLGPLRERAALQRLEIESLIARGASVGASQATTEAATTEAQNARKAVLTQLQQAELRYAAAISEGLSVEQQRVRLETALADAKRADTVATKQLAIAHAEGNAELFASLGPLQARAAALVANAEGALLNVEAEETRVAVTQQAAAVQERANKAIGVNVGLIKSRADLAALDNELSAVAAELKTLQARAEETENAALQRNIIQLERRIAAQQAAIASQRKLIQSEKEAAAAHELAARGAGATGLAALGARGATLAASAEFLVGAAAATAFFKAVSSAANLETQLNVFQATAGATADEMERVSETAKELGADITLPAVGAGDAAEAMTELAKAGLSVTDSIDGARGVLQLATAASIDNAQATEIAASGLNAFGLAGTQAIHVADLLTGAAIESQGTIADMGVALQQSAAAARQAGLSIEDTVALLTLLARNGLKGSDAGTSLRTALIRLLNPTKKAQEELDKLNVRLRDSTGAVRAEVFSDLGVALDRLSVKQRNAALATIFGQDAFRAASIFAREGATGLDRMREATDQQGLAAQIAGARTKGFAGQVEALKNAAETLGIEFGQATIPLLTTVVETASEGVGIIQRLARAFDDLEKSLPGEGSQGGPKSGVEGFFAGLKDTLLTSGGDVIKEFDAALTLIQKRPVGEAFDFGKTPLQTLNSVNAELAKTIDNADELGDALARAGRGGSGPVGNVVETLREMRAQILGNTEEAAHLRARIDDVIRLAVALGRAPTPVELEVFFEKGQVDAEIQRFEATMADLNPQIKGDILLTPNIDEAKVVADKAADEAFNAFERVFGHAPPIDFTSIFSNAEKDAGDAGEKAGRAFSVSFDDALAIAAASGVGLSGQLAKARRLRDNSQRFFERIQAEVASGERPEGDPLLGKAAQELEKRKAAVEALENEIDQNAKDASDKVVKARNEADQKILDAFEAQTRAASNALLRAGSTPGLQDDIKRQRAFRDLIKRQLDEAEKTLKDAKTRAQVVGQLTTDLINANQRLAELNKQLQDSLQEAFEIRVDIARATGNVTRLRKLFAERLRQLKAALADAKEGTLAALELQQQIIQTQQAAFDAINESFELDIEFATITGNKAKELKAREAFIEQLRREQAQYKKGSLEWKRLRNEIEQQKKEIEDVRKARKDLFAEMTFNFLEAQAGFAANLLGNLLPLGAIAGTVGRTGSTLTGPATGGGAGATPGGPFELPREQQSGLTMPNPKFRPGGGPGAAVKESQRLAQAEATGGFTAAQAARLLALTQQMVHLLSHIDQKAKHPESRRAQSTNNAALDIHK